MKHIQPTSNLPTRSSDLVIVDTFEGGDPVGIKSLPGYQYLFPQVEIMAPVRGLRFHIAAHDFPATLDGKPVITAAQLTAWTVTMREPDGRFILQNVPCTRFVTRNILAGVFGIQRQLLYFTQDTLPDARQCYLTSPVEMDKAVIPFTLLY